MAVILNAFAQRRRWTQAELAVRAGLTVPAVRRRLIELQSAGIPFDVNDDPPHKVWSVPEGWFPGAVMFDASESAELLRVLVQAPRSTARDRLIARVTRGLPPDAPVRTLSNAVDVPQLDPVEERALATLQAAVGSSVVRMHWYSEKRGELEWREMSPHIIALVPSPRAVGFCHRDEQLKWFKACNMLGIEKREAALFRRVVQDEIDTFVHSSMDGYHGDEITECVFEAREQEWRWIRNQLRAQSPDVADAQPGWRRVTIRTSAVLIIARYLVGLGDAVRAVSPALQARVRVLAEGAMRALDERHEPT